jgi:hypothetical protein
MTNSMPQALPAFVRVIGIRRRRFVEFEYMVGDPDLNVELIMPIPAFTEFCEQQKVVLEDKYDLLSAARDGTSVEPASAGLYHQPSWHRDP